MTSTNRMSFHRSGSELNLVTTNSTPLPATVTAWHTRYRATKATLPNLEKFFKARANLEEEYAQRLENLAYQPLGDHEVGAVGLAMQAARKEVIESATSHRTIAAKMREELQRPCSQRASEFSNLKRQYVSTFLSQQQTQSNHLALLDRAKERCQEANQLGGAELCHSADQELQLCTARLEDATSTFETDVSRSLEGFQKLELGRLQFIRNVVWKYTNLLSSLCVSDDEGLERVRGALEKLEANSEVEGFLNGMDASENEKSVPSELPTAIPQELTTSDDKIALARSSPLRNEINKPNDPRFNQVVSTLNASAMADPNIAQGSTPVTPVTEKSRVISMDMVSATIARSPILAAKRSSGSGRPSPRTPSQSSAAPPPPRALPSQSVPPLSTSSQQSAPSPVTSPDGRPEVAMVIACHQPPVDRPLSGQPGHPPPMDRPFNGQPGHPQSLERTPSGNYSHPHSPYHEYPPTSDLRRSYSGTSQHAMVKPPPSRQSYTPPTSNPHPHHRNSMPPPQPYHPNQLERANSNPSSDGGGTTSPRSRLPPPSQPPSAPTSMKPLDQTHRPDSKPILFYVKAIYDYDADIPEELSLREGQILAVLATQLDGWWEGELHDAGKVKRGIFPSNFTEPVSL